MSSNNDQVPSIGGFFSNLGAGAHSFADSILNLPADAVHTVQSAYDAAQRGDTKKALDITEGALNAVNPNTVISNAVTGFAKNIYKDVGSPLQGGDILGRAAKNAYNNPFQVGLDASAVLPAVGAVGKIAGGAGEVGEAADAAGEAASAVPKMNPLQKAGHAIQSDVQPIRLKPSVYGAGREEAVQQTVNNDVAGVTAAQKYANLEPTLKNYGAQIKQTLASEPKDIPISEVKQAIYNHLDPEIRSGDITPQQAQQVINEYIPKMYTAARKVNALENTTGAPIAQSSAEMSAAPTTIKGESQMGSYKLGATEGVDPKTGLPIGGRLYESLPKINPESYTPPAPTPWQPNVVQDINPDTISSPDLFPMKVIANHDLNSVYDKLDRGKALSPTEIIQKAGRDGLDDVISKYHPGVKDLTVKQSHLYDAANSLSKARDVSGAPMQVLGTTIPGNVTKAIQGVAGKAVSGLGNAESAVGKVLGKIGGAGRAGEIASLVTGSNSLNNQGNNNENDQKDNHGGMVSQGTTNVKGSVFAPDVKPDATGKWAVPTLTTSSGLYITNAERQQKEAGLTPGTPEYQRIENNYSKSLQEAQTRLGDKLPDFMRNAKGTILGGNGIKQELDTLPTNFLNQFKDWNAATTYAANSDNQYAQEVKDILDYNSRYANAYEQINNEKLQPNSKLLIQPSDPPQLAQKKLYDMQAFMVKNYQDNLEPWLVTNSASGIQTPQGQAAVAPTQGAPQATTGNVGFSTPFKPVTAPNIGSTLPPITHVSY